MAKFTAILLLCAASASAVVGTDPTSSTAYTSVSVAEPSPAESPSVAAASSASTSAPMATETPAASAVAGCSKDGPNPQCRMYCEFGFAKDAKGCYKCKCVTPKNAPLSSKVLMTLWRGMSRVCDADRPVTS